MKKIILSFLICTTPLLAQNGILDTSFGNNGIVIDNIISGESSNAVDIVLLPNGNINLLCTFWNGNYGCKSLRQFNPDGFPNASFGNNGKIIYDLGSGHGGSGILDRFENGSMIILGTFFEVSQGKLLIMKVDENGIKDISFGIDGMIIQDIDSNRNEIPTSLTILNDGSMIISGYINNSSPASIFILKLLPNGDLDTSFGNGGTTINNLTNNDDELNVHKILDNGKILIGGTIKGSGYSNFFLSRYNNNGILDTTFGTDGVSITSVGSHNEILDMDINQDDKIIVVGEARIQPSNKTDFVVAQFNPDGSLDSNFGNNGAVLTNFGNTFDRAQSLIIQPDNKLVLLGYSGTQSAWDFALARYYPDGSLDETFGTNGLVTTNVGVTSDIIAKGKLQSEGKILAIGKAWTGSYYEMAMAQYTSGIVLGILDFINKENTFVYPNPVDTEVQLRYELISPEKITIGIYDLNGRLLRYYLQDIEKVAGVFEESLSLKSLASGNYLLKISNGNQYKTIKILKK